MKKILIALLMFSSIALVFNACTKEETSFDETLLIGKWVSGTVFYKYVSDYTGKTWDTADNVTEEEAQSYTWSLVQDQLTHIHILEMGGTVPKVYTVTQLTATSLKYEDDFGVSYTYTKVQ